MEFSLSLYRKLLISLKKEYRFIRIKDLPNLSDKENIVVLKHDVDAKPKNALKMAQIENELGIASTYYFRSVQKVFHPSVIKSISNLDHDIGYHYEELSKTKGNYVMAYNQFSANLSKLRSLVDVRTISMHGSPLSKINNKDLWEKYSYYDFNVICISTSDSIFDGFFYLTDTGRKINNKNVNVRDYNNVKLVKLEANNINGIINKIDKLPSRMLLNFHPQRWTDNKIEWYIDFIIQAIKNFVKFSLKQIRNAK
jgi:hypothetical protein